MERHTCLTQNQDFKGSNPFLPTILIENKLYNNIDAYSNTFMALTFNQNTYTIASCIKIRRSDGTGRHVSLRNLCDERAGSTPACGTILLYMDH